MNALRKVIGNTVISLLGQGVTWTSTLLLTIAYGRFLGDVKFGELYFALSFVMLVGFPLEFGFNQQLTRDVAQKPGRALQYLSNILCIKLLFWIVLYGCIILACKELGYSVEVRMLVGVCGITLLSTALANTFGSLHYAFGRVVFPVVGAIFEKGLSALVGIIVLRQGAGVQVIVYILLGSSLINMLWQAGWALRLVGIPLRFDVKLIRSLLHTSIPFLAYGVLGVIYYRLDTVLLSLMTNNAVVGWYGAGYRLFDTLVFLPSLVISAIMYPVFSKLSISSESDLQVAVEKSLNFLLFCGTPIATALIVGAPTIIGFLYHRAEFSHAIPALQGLAPGLLFLYINSVLSATIISTKNEKKITLMAAVALVFNLGLNLVLIPRYQHIGAAVVTSLTELLLLCFALTFTPRALLPRGSVMVGIKALAASLVMGLVMLLMGNLNFLVILPIAALTYLAVAMVLGTIPSSDLLMLYSAIRRRKQGDGTTASDGEDALASIIAVAPNVYAGTSSDLQSPLIWRSEWTDPSLVALRHKLKDLDSAAIAALYANTQPRMVAYKPACKQQVCETHALSTLDEDTQPRIAERKPIMHISQLIAITSSSQAKDAQSNAYKETR